MVMIDTISSYKWCLPNSNIALLGVISVPKRAFNGNYVPLIASFLVLFVSSKFRAKMRLAITRKPLYI